MLKIQGFCLDKQKSFDPKKILSVPCTNYHVPWIALFSVNK